MNKNRLLLLLALPLIGCQSEPLATPDGENTLDITSKITIQASTAVESKVGFEETTTAEGLAAMTLTWQSTDSFSVYDSEGNYVGDFGYSGTEGATSGTFTQSGDFSMTNGEYTAVLPAVTYPTLAERDAALSTATQAVTTIEDLEYLNSAIALKSTFTFDTEKNNVVAFEHEWSMLKVTLVLPDGVVAQSITVTDQGASYSLSLPTLSESTISAYVAVNANSETVSSARDITFSIEGSDGNTHESTVSTAVTFVAGYLYTVSLNLSGVYDYWVEGYTIPDGSMTYSSANGTLITTAEATNGVYAINSNGIYFIDEGVSVTLATQNRTNLVIIGRHSTTKTPVEISGIIKAQAGDGIVYKNLSMTLDSSYSANYVFNGNGNGSADRLVFDDCTVEFNKIFFYSSGVCAIKDIYVNNCNIAISGNLFRFAEFVPADEQADTYKSFTLTNSTIQSYSGSAIKAVYLYALIEPTSNGEATNTNRLTAAAAPSIKIVNNILNNFVGSNAYLVIPSSDSIVITDNIFRADTDAEYNSYLLQFTSQTEAPSTLDIYTNNIYYGLTKNWIDFTSGSTYSVNGTQNMTKSETDPLATE